MSINVVRLADAHRAELHELLLAENWTQLAKELQQNSLQVFTQYVALARGHVVGWLEGTARHEADAEVPGFPTPWAQVNYVLIHPAMRRRGIAGDLLRRFAHDEHRAGRRFMVLWHDRREDSGGRFAFCTAHGFQPIAGTGLVGVDLQQLLTSPGAAPLRE
ncbi:GNAT family N-acetyltransferase [Streptomyces sp. NPDC056462]|uniref:GNAT family N-acetyltransferase n=1 Tax=Streptomyces sp. NPDC056462 TaxID=3345826 RepID=UPI00367FE70A